MPTAEPEGALVTEPPVAAVYHTTVSPVPAVALPVLTVPSKQAVTLPAMGAVMAGQGSTAPLL